MALLVRISLALALALVLAAPGLAREQAGYVDLVNAAEFAPPRPYPAAGEAGPFVWRGDIVRPGATFIKIHFAEFALAPGDTLTVAGPDGSQVREYRDLGPRGTGEFWAFAVRGERALVTLTSYGAGGGAITVDEIGVGTEIIGPDAVCGSDGREDVACYANGKTLTRQVSRLLFQDGPFFFVCTGFLVSGSNSSTLMTNQHCIDDQTGVNSLEAWFNYQNSNCGGGADDPIDEYFGGTFLITDVGLDYSLMTMLGNPEGAYGELVATRLAPQVGNRMVLPQHSGGNEKKVGVFEGVNRTGGPCTIKGVRADLSGWTNDSQMFYTCDMEGGSSGSPVIGREQSNRVIGINHVEYVGCPGGSQVNYATHIDRICDDAGSLLNCN
jgi:hypothetical protein